MQIQDPTVTTYGPAQVAELSATQQQGTIYGAIRAACAKWPKADFFTDFEGATLTREKLVLGAEVLGARFTSIAQPGERVGLMLPNVAGMPVVLCALFAAGIVPAMLNFTVGSRGLLAAVRIVQAKKVITSKKFIEKANLQAELEALQTACEVLFVEDIRETLSLRHKLTGIARAKLPNLSRRWRSAKPDDEAIVLFTSGTEGTPKGVSLSHTNILANLAQIHLRLYFDGRDGIFSALPTFHCFGLTAGLFLPLIGGFRTFFYPTPLHFKQIPPLIKSSKATALITTDTFLGHWGRAAEREDFSNLRLIVCGAERVNEPTRAFVREKFGKEILEGYGVTETSPVLAVNDPDGMREGSVGAAMAGVEARIEPVEGIANAGRLFVRGPNILRGYYLIEAPGVLFPSHEGWHDTGDIVHLSADGHISIRGRAKRFAKIAGETVSLPAVEMMVSRALPGFGHAVVAAPDARKGEVLVLVTTCLTASRDALNAQARADGISELQIPRVILAVEGLPMLSTGKINYVELDELVKQKVAIDQSSQ